MNIHIAAEKRGQVRITTRKDVEHAVWDRLRGALVGKSFRGATLSAWDKTHKEVKQPVFAVVTVAAVAIELSVCEDLLRP